MNLDVIENGKVVKGVIYDRGIVTLPAIGVDEDTFLFSGDINVVNEKVNLLKVAFDMASTDSSDLKVIPLYKKLSSSDCLDVIDMAKNYTGTSFIKELSEVFFTDGLEEWLKHQKENKESRVQNRGIVY